MFGTTPTEEQKPLENLIEDDSPKNEPEPPVEEPPAEPEDPPAAEDPPEPEPAEEPTPDPPEEPTAAPEEEPTEDDVVTEVPTEQTNGLDAEVLQIESGEEQEDQDDVVEPAQEPEEEQAEPDPEPVPEEAEATPEEPVEPEAAPEPETEEAVDSGGGDAEVGVIEGVVNGEDEVETLNNDENNSTTEDKGDSDPLDSDISEMVDSGNMEQLAAIVLNGDGARLVGQSSDNPEIQAFLDNVPIYMVSANCFFILFKLQGVHKR